MAKVVHQIDPKFSAALKAAKEKLDIAKAEVAAAEDAIYEASKAFIAEKGTTHVTGVKIETGFNDTWDQEKLRELQKTWSQHSNAEFPFKEELKADGKAISYIRENVKEVWKILSAACSSKPKKPTFTLED